MAQAISNAWYINYGAGLITQAAAASWTTASTTITMSSTIPAGVVAGFIVVDQTTGKVIGTVSTWVSTTLTLNAAAAFNSSRSPAADLASSSSAAAALGTEVSKAMTPPALRVAVRRNSGAVAGSGFDNPHRAKVQGHIATLFSVCQSLRPCFARNPQLRVGAGHCPMPPQ